MEFVTATEFQDIFDHKINIVWGKFFCLQSHLVEVFALYYFCYEHMAKILSFFTKRIKILTDFSLFGQIVDFLTKK